MLHRACEGGGAQRSEVHIARPSLLFRRGGSGGGGGDSGGGGGGGGGGGDGGAGDSGGSGGGSDDAVGAGGGAGGAGGGGDFELRVLEVNARTTMTHYARAAKRRFPRAKRFEVCARTPTYLPTHLLTYVLT